MTSRLSPGTVAVTGASRGLGREIARTFADDGWRVLAVVRTRPAAALAEGDAGGRIRYLEADLADLNQVVRLRDELRSADVDAVVNNAATLSASRIETAQGIESVLAVNALAPTVLDGAVEHPPRRNGARRPVIVDVSSGGVAMGDPADPFSRRYTPNRSYSVSKLARAAMVLEKIAAADQEGVPSPRHVLVDPGPMRTGMGEDMPGFFGFFNRRIKPMAQPLSRTARTVVDAVERFELPDAIWLDRRGDSGALPKNLRAGATRSALARDVLAALEGALDRVDQA